MPKMSVNTLRPCVMAALLLAGLAIAPAVRADDLADRVKQLEAKLAASLQTIDKLSARVSELERTSQRPTPALAAASAVPAAGASAPPASAPIASAAASAPAADARLA